MLKIRAQTAIFISIIIVLTGIVLTSIFGLWTTQSSKTPRKLRIEQYAQQYDPADIRGSYSFSEISNLFHIPLEDLAAAFLVEEDNAAEFKCKELETIFADAPNEIGTGSVKLFVAFYLSLPFEPGEDTWLPEAAAQILKEKSNMPQEALNYLENHTTSFTEH